MLSGRIIILTRPEDPDDRIRSGLERLGASVIPFPMIAIEPVAIDPATLSSLIAGSDWSWVVITSRNGVDSLFGQLDLQPGDPLPFRTAVYGGRTAEAMTDRGFVPDYTGTQDTSGEFWQDLSGTLRPGDRILQAIGDRAAGVEPGILPDGVTCSRIDVYRTLSVNAPDPAILDRIRNDRYDLIVFTSPSGFDTLLAHLRQPADPGRIRAACIGPVTASALRRGGVEPVVTARPSGAEGLVSGIREYFASNR